MSRRDTDVTCPRAFIGTAAVPGDDVFHVAEVEGRGGAGAVIALYGIGAPDTLAVGAIDKGRGVQALGDVLYLVGGGVGEGASGAGELVAVLIVGVGLGPVAGGGSQHCGC